MGFAEGVNALRPLSSLPKKYSSTERSIHLMKLVVLVKEFSIKSIEPTVVSKDEFAMISNESVSSMTTGLVDLTLSL